MLRFACVGAGWVTMNRHVKALRRHPRVRLAGIIDHNPTRARSAGAKLGIAHGTGLDAPFLEQVDAVTIGTPPDTHHRLAVEALGRGLHVLVEKPLAMDEAQGREMIETARRAGRVLAVVHNFQFARSVAEARRRIRSGEAGELKSVLGLQLSSHQRRLPTWYKRLPGGLFYDEAPHLFYLLKSFLPQFAVTKVHVSRSLDPEDNTPRFVSTIHDAGPCIGTVQMFFDTAMSEWQLVLMGTRETLLADIFRDILVRLPSDRNHGARDILATSANAVGGHLWGTLSSGLLHLRGALDYGNDEVVRRFVAAVEEGKEPEGISASDGLLVVAAMARVAEAIRAG
jgi:scyllo-inositol 2-dehydrogenase (NADP+)